MLIATVHKQIFVNFFIWSIDFSVSKTLNSSLYSLLFISWFPFISLLSFIIYFSIYFLYHFVSYISFILVVLNLINFHPKTLLIAHPNDLYISCFFSFHHSFACFILCFILIFIFILLFLISSSSFWVVKLKQFNEILTSS